ncbi:hypothetical protein [Galactobacter sp.]|uniref:hypothetical protein n=1 Tax=Galactobacter sp. TaxID=2676125 RepID=UPI0025BF8859|nr:hypothetical protein [Galactobacter sp.]
MAMDNVPWLVEEAGVAHPSSSARTLAWAATGGQRGVIGSASMAVVPTSVPGPNVMVKAGGAVIPSTYAGAKQETYIVRNRTATTLPIAATGSAGGRTDAIIARIDDTGMTGVHPDDVQAYDYAKVEVIQGVSAGVTDVDQLGLAYPAVLLAKVKLPASTGTVTAAMITDLRKIALAREETVQYPRPLVKGDNTGNDLVLTSTQSYPKGEWWPNTGGEDDDGLQYVDCPRWATRMQIRAEWLSVKMPKGSSWGSVWVSWGPGAGSSTPTRSTQAFRWDADSASSQRVTLTVVDEVYIPAALRGTRIAFVLRGNRMPVANEIIAAPFLDAVSGINLEVRFLERPDTDDQAD